MSSEIIPTEYGGKVKAVTWPPNFNSGLKPKKIADLFFIKMEYGLRPYFLSGVDFNTYNGLNKESDSQELFNFIPNGIVLNAKNQQDLTFNDY